MYKNNYGSYLNLYKYFFHFEVLASNTIKNKTEKVQKLTWNKFSKAFIRIPGRDKKTCRSYRHTKNVQNNCIKLSGFGVDIVDFFCSGK